MGVPLRWIVAMTLLVATWPALAQVRVSITVGPPPLPVYEQPLCPGDGYLWTPGYWAWDNVTGGYYWVPGTWITPPEVGLLWTPGYWAWQNTAFVFVRGYWGPVIGFYGGINYGFGYPGHGYYGGRWTGGHFFYNRSVANVNVTVVHNTYVENVTVERSANRVSYNGKDGIAARPTAPEVAAGKEKHVAATQVQAQHVQHARSTPELYAAQNKGKPPVPAMARPEASRNPETGTRDGATRSPPAATHDADRSRGAEQPQGAARSQGAEQPKPQATPQHAERPPGNPGGPRPGGDAPKEHGNAAQPPRAGDKTPPNDRAHDEHSNARQENQHDKDEN
jgi:hypothetical protein